MDKKIPIISKLKIKKGENALMLSRGNNVPSVDEKNVKAFIENSNLSTPTDKLNRKAFDAGLRK